MEVYSHVTPYQDELLADDGEHSNQLMKKQTWMASVSTATVLEARYESKVPVNSWFV